MVEHLQTISVPTQQAITKIAPQKIETNSSENFEILQNATKNIQDIQEKISAKSILVYSWQNLANLLTNKILSGKLSKNEMLSSRNMVEGLDIQINNAKKEIEQLKAQLEAEKNSASQDNITKNESQKAQVLAQNVLALKSTTEQTKQ